MIEFIQNNIIAHMYMLVLFYYAPVALCLFGYTLRVWKFIQIDKEKCKEKFYSPSITYGGILGYLVLSTLPAVNLAALVFDLLGSFLKFLGKVFDKPLVSKKGE